jgi:hypothetical protein
MRLLAYRTSNRVPVIRPATPRRPWMDETTSRFAYRCLPLTMGNQLGWEVLSPCAFEALWTGGKALGAIQIVRLGEGDGPLPQSHFGHGILTFHPCHLFRTEAPYGMWVGGPPNTPKDGIAPLTGYVETDWLPFTFTMNWVFTRPGVPIRFEEGEPFCHFFPVSASVLESVDPEVHDLDDDPELARQYRDWTRLRDEWNEDMKVEGTQANREGWQRFYHKGLLYTGEEAGAAQHQTRLRLCPFHAPAASAADAGAEPPSAPAAEKARPRPARSRAVVP